MPLRYDAAGCIVQQPSESGRARVYKHYCYPPLDTAATLVDPHGLLRVMSLTRKRTATPVARYVWTTVPAPARQDSRVSRRLVLSYLLSASRLYRHLSVVMPINDIVHCTQTWLLLNSQWESESRVALASPVYDPGTLLSPL